MNITELEVVDSPDGEAGLIWVDPRSLAANPLNPRIHPVEQTECLRELIENLGWLQPLCFNLETGHLVDGHERLEIAIREGYAAVPVWVGRWSEDDESKIVVALSESGRLATWNKERTTRLVERLRDGGGAIARLTAELSAREGLAGLVAKTRGATPVQPAQQETTQTGGSTDDPRVESLKRDEGVVSASRVRLVHLFLNSESIKKFTAQVDVLVEHFHTENVTDAVMIAVEDAYTKALRNGIGRR